MATISTKQLAQICRRTGTSLRAGVDARRVWDQEAQRGGLRKRQAMQQIGRRLNEGHSIAESMKDSNGFFPPLFCELVAVGEETGRLDETLIQLADHYDHRIELRREFLIGIAWPAVQLIATIMIMSIVIFVMGMITPADGRGFDFFGLTGGRGVLVFWTIFALIGGGIALAVSAVVRGWAGPLPIIIAMRIPYLGACLREFALARLARTLSMALDAGIDARRSIGLALRSTQNPFYTSRAATIDQAVLEGNQFHVALDRANAFPQEFIDDLATAELAGTESESMDRLAQSYLARARTASSMLTGFAAIAVWLLVVAFILLMIYKLVLFVIAPYQEAFEFLDSVY